MQIQTADRLAHINEYYFSQKLREIEILNNQGNDVINLGIGSPDLPPHASVIATLQQEAAKVSAHAYQPYKGSPILRKAVAAWYSKWYKATLDYNTEILPLLGSKEGIMHICMTYLNKGDQALLPNPGYPTYQSAIALAGATPIPYSLTEANNWLPDIDALSNTDLTKVKLMFVNYPHMPTGQLPINNVFEKIIAFAKANQILVVNDNPYSFILTKTPSSILSITGAKEVAIELNSLSKSQNMAGWRVGVMCGDKQRIDEVLKYKSNMDSGMFLPIQLAAAKALELDSTWYDNLNVTYEARKQKAYALLDSLQCSYDKAQAGLFVWAKIPAHWADGYKLSDAVLYKAHVFLTPGGIFGSNGNNYVRVSLCATEHLFEQAIARINSAKNLLPNSYL